MCCVLILALETIVSLHYCIENIHYQNTLP